MLLREARDRFIHYLDSLERSPETIRGYRMDITLFERYLSAKLNGPPYLEEVTAEDIEDYLRWLKDKRNYAPASRLRCLHSLRSFFAWACKKELVKRNVALLVENIKLPQKERLYLSEAELNRLIKAISHPLNAAAARLGWNKRVTAHVLRHSFASHLLQNEVNLVQIQKLLGHSSLRVTGLYTHTDLDRLREAVNTLGKEERHGFIP